jgi:flagellar capping protein FliD
MSDEDKRLDAIEKWIASTTKIMDSNTKTLGDFDKNITKRLDDAITQINTNDKSYEKRLDALEKSSGKSDADVKKLQQRCANLEAVVKKLSK